MSEQGSREHLEEVAQSIAGLPQEERDKRERLALAHILGEATGLEIEPGDFDDEVTSGADETLEEAIASGKVEFCNECLTPGGHHRLGCKNA